MFWMTNQLQKLVELEHFEDVHQIPQIQVKSSIFFDFPYETNGEII